MSTLTYKDYLEYIKFEFSKIDFNSLSEEEKSYYEVVKRDLDNSKNMSWRILNSPALPSKDSNQETNRKIENIKSKVGIRGKINRINQIVISQFRNKVNSFAFVPNLAIIIIGIVVSYFLAKSYPLNITISTPNITWETTTSYVPSNHLGTPGVPLYGTGGGAGVPSDEESQIETHVMKVYWKKNTFDITYMTWGMVPILILIVIVYLPAIKWAWAK